MRKKMNYNEAGLTDKEVLEARKKFGSNEITSVKQEGFFKLLLSTLGDPIIKILLIALGIKTIFLIKDFDWYETIGIVIAIFLASFISTISEYGSEQAFKKLQDESSKTKCRVRRNGKLVEVLVDEVVMGDLVYLQAGDKIPADGVLVQGDISVDESALNGETKEAYKEAVIDSSHITKKNQVFRGTVVYSKEAVMLVDKIGNATFYGKIAQELQEKQPESPLKLRLRHLASIISRIGYVSAFLVAFSYLFSVVVIQNQFDMTRIMEMLHDFPLLFGHLLYALTLSVTIIVVAVPEGLPMMITLVLSSNMKRMLKNNVLVRKLVGIETAGSLNILFTDKTGTLTKGRLEVIGVMSGERKGYVNQEEVMEHPGYYRLLKLSMAVNNAASYDIDKNCVIGGNITDRALLEFMNVPVQGVERIRTIPFDSKNKYAVSIIQGNHQRFKLIKGAPEKILPYCTGYYNEAGERRYLASKKELNRTIEKTMNKGVRVLALAIGDCTKEDTDFRNSTLVGLVFIKDEIRDEAKEGIQLVHDAHIQTVMITGDNKNTAMAIAKELGLLQSSSDVVLTSDELQRMSDDEVKRILPNLRVVARSLPQDKSRLIRLSQELDLVVGMTGDGVNDAPALKKADVGFAMGSGTEVSKEAADIVILDDNFLSISKAILFGRTIFKSIRKFIIFQLTINICAISLSVLGPFIGVNSPITVIQMLWINMVMDTLAGLAFAFEPPRLEYMKEKPKRKDEPILNSYMKGEILFTGFYSALLCVIFLKCDFLHEFFRMDDNNRYIMTAFFGLFIFMGVFNSFNARTHRINLLAHLFQNRVFVITIAFIVFVQIILIYYGGEIFRTAGLTYSEFLVIMLLAATVIPVDWLRKGYLRMHGEVGGV